MKMIRFESFSKLDRVGLMALVIVNAVSIFGYGTFGLHPEWVAIWDWVPRVFALAYPIFAQLQIVLAFAVFMAAMIRHLRFEWWSLFLATFGLSLLSEWTGTTYGIPFGKYEYTHLLGPMIGGKVPWLIPISWFFMGFASYGMIVRIQGDRLDSRAFRIFLGSILLLSWDLTLDPAMSFLTPFWLWENPGFFYGMPALNLFGWFVTGVLIMGAFELLGGYKLAGRMPMDFCFAFYLANLMLPVGFVIVAGLWGSLILTLVVALCFYGVDRRLKSTRFGSESVRTG
jgi:putative membrane protein